MRSVSNSVVIGFAVLALQGCMMNSQDEVLATDGTQLQMRMVQSRMFDTQDQAAT